MRHAQNDATFVEVTGIDVTSREALLALTKMTNNAYFAGPDDGWHDVKGLNHVSGLRPERLTLDESGLRSPFPLVGNPPQTVLESMSSFQGTTALSRWWMV